MQKCCITGAGETFSAGGDFEMIKEIIGDFESRARALASGPLGSVPNATL
jgi:hypothetical protein